VLKSRVTLWDLVIRTTKRPVWHAIHAVTGHRLAMPVHYLDTSLVGAVFRVPSPAILGLVPRDQFDPDVDDDGLARLYVIAMEHRECDILRPYRELAVTVLGHLCHKQDEQVHFYLHLPVTTEDARWPGVENYGFPKYRAEIAFSLAGARSACALSLDGSSILELSVGKASVSEQAWAFTNLTMRGRTLVLSRLLCEGQRAHADTAGGASIRLGPHPIGRELAALGIEERSVSHFYCPQLRAVLSKPMPLA
jgi:hypothetical protein